MENKYFEYSLIVFGDMMVSNRRSAGARINSYQTSVSSFVLQSVWWILKSIQWNRKFSAEKKNYHSCTRSMAFTNSGPMTCSMCRQVELKINNNETRIIRCECNYILYLRNGHRLQNYYESFECSVQLAYLSNVRLKW